MFSSLMPSLYLESYKNWNFEGLRIEMFISLFINLEFTVLSNHCCIH
jgi:hypothetical protein